jgi:hypothetical protein
MSRRFFLSKLIATSSTTFFCFNISNLFGTTNSFSSSNTYDCVLNCDIPKNLSVKQYLNKKYEIYSFQEIKNLVDEFKQNSQILTERRVINSSSDRWYVKFRSKQDFLAFIRASQTIGLNDKQRQLSKDFGFSQHWTLPS